MSLKSLLRSLWPRAAQPAVSQPSASPAIKPRGGPKVIGIGLWKTGTTTLGQCLRTLGYTVSEYDLEAVDAVVRGDIPAALDYVAQFDAMEDVPWFMLYKELDQRFPGARFILTTRKDDETWLTSSRKHVARHTPEHNNRAIDPITEYYLRLDPHRERWHNFHSMHNAAVQAYFADRPNDLLTVCWEHGDGWKELCTFLGDPVPEGLPFPHANAAPEQPETATSSPGCEAEPNGT